MIFCEKSPRFETRNFKKVATFLCMVQVGNKKYIKMSNREFENWNPISREGCQIFKKKHGKIFLNGLPIKS